MSETTLDAKIERRTAKRNKSRRERRDKKVGLPAPAVFWLVAPFGATGVVAPLVWDYGWAWMTFSMILVQIGVLLINDRRGFIRSREMRRAYEARRHFSIMETIVLFVLVMANMLAVAYAILMANAP